MHTSATFVGVKPLATPKCLRRQAARCAALAAETYDEESRLRYIRLEQTYLQLAETEEPLDEDAVAFTGETKVGSRLTA